MVIIQESVVGGDPIESTSVHGHVLQWFDRKSTTCDHFYDT